MTLKLRLVQYKFYTKTIVQYIQSRNHQLIFLEIQEVFRCYKNVMYLLSCNLKKMKVNLKKI